MRKYLKRVIRCVAIAAVVVVLRADFAFAMTQAEFLPKVHDALGFAAPARYFTLEEGELTKGAAVRNVLEGMGWGFVLDMYNQVFMLPEWSDRDPLATAAETMKPQVPASLREHFDEPFAEEDLPILREWVAACKKGVSLHAHFGWEGVDLVVIKRGIGNPLAPANGTENGVNEPRYLAALAVDMGLAPCQIATAQMVGAPKATLATIAVENYGVIGGINGGYFGGSKPIGILRRQGMTEHGHFWPKRSAFGWNDKGEFVFVDAREVSSIGREYDKYSEMMQAGPLLVKDGQPVTNTEDIQPGVLNKRHPRSLVGTDGRRVVWAVIDGRNNMHSVGATIEETREACRWLGLKTALNLDGGGSSSIWWRGMTFTKPSNSRADERPIPYAVLIFQQGHGVRQ